MSHSMYDEAPFLELGGNTVYREDIFTRIAAEEPSEEGEGGEKKAPKKSKGGGKGGASALRMLWAYHPDGGGRREVNPDTTSDRKTLIRGWKGPAGKAAYKSWRDAWMKMNPDKQLQEAQGVVKGIKSTGAKKKVEGFIAKLEGIVSGGGKSEKEEAPAEEKPKKKAPKKKPAKGKGGKKKAPKKKAPKKKAPKDAEAEGAAAEEKKAPKRKGPPPLPKKKKRKGPPPIPASAKKKAKAKAAAAEASKVSSAIEKETAKGGKKAKAAGKKIQKSVGRLGELAGQMAEGKATEETKTEAQEAVVSVSEQVGRLGKSLGAPVGAFKKKTGLRGFLSSIASLFGFGRRGKKAFAVEGETVLERTIHCASQHPEMKEHLQPLIAAEMRQRKQRKAATYAATVTVAGHYLADRSASLKQVARTVASRFLTARRRPPVIKPARARYLGIPFQSGRRVSVLVQRLSGRMMDPVSGSTVRRPSVKEPLGLYVRPVASRSQSDAKVTLRNPIVIDGGPTGKEWVKAISKVFNGLQGEDLTRAIYKSKRGADAIVVIGQGTGEDGKPTGMVREIVMFEPVLRGQMTNNDARVKPREVEPEPEPVVEPEDIVDLEEEEEIIEPTPAPEPPAPAYEVEEEIIEPEPEPASEPVSEPVSESEAVEALSGLLDPDDPGFFSVTAEEVAEEVGSSSDAARGVLQRLESRGLVVSEDVNGQYLVYGLSDAGWESLGYTPDGFGGFLEPGAEPEPEPVQPAPEEMAPPSAPPPAYELEPEVEEEEEEVVDFDSPETPAEMLEEEEEEDLPGSEFAAPPADPEDITMEDMEMTPEEEEEVFEAPPAAEPGFEGEVLPSDTWHEPLATFPNLEGIEFKVLPGDAVEYRGQVEIDGELHDVSGEVAPLSMTPKGIAEELTEDLKAREDELTISGPAPGEYEFGGGYGEDPFGGGGGFDLDDEMSLFEDEGGEDFDESWMY